MPLTPEARAALLVRYAAGADAFEAAIVDLGDGELDAHPFPGEWSIREIAHHLGDGELNSAIRLRRLLAEDRPALLGYDENAYARILHYADRPIDTSLAAMRAARASTLTLLERLEERDWARAGTHTERGPYSVEAWLEDYANHPHDHADQARRVLAAVRGHGGG